MSEKLKNILKISESIRFVSLISNEGVFLNYLYRDDLKRTIFEEKQKQMGGRVAISGDIHKTMDKQLGRSLFSFTHREKYDSLLVYLDKKILVVSLELNENYEQLIEKIIKQSDSLNV